MLDPPVAAAITLAIWRWQGKVSRIKALTLPGACGRAGRRDPWRQGRPAQPYLCPAAQASRSCRFSTLPLALRGSGSEVSAMVSGTL